MRTIKRHQHSINSELILQIKEEKHLTWNDIAQEVGIKADSIPSIIDKGYCANYKVKRNFELWIMMNQSREWQIKRG